MAGAEGGKSLVTPAGPGAPPPGQGEACWHALDAPAVLLRLGSSPAGLADEEHARRLAYYGPNLPEGQHKREPWWEELGESFTEPLQLLLIAVAVLSAVFGELRDAIAIAAIIAAVAVTETVTEVRAAAAIEALRAMTAPTARLHRKSHTAEVPAASLVPGDVVAVEAGDIVPADARVLATRGLRVDESTLTGEAGPAGKSEQPVPAGTGLAGRSSLLHAGTAVAAGEGRAVVVATGQDSELGRLGRLAAESREPPTPLQAAMSQLARGVLVAAIAACVLVPAVGLAAGQPWRDMLLAGLTVAFATVPEELPILITVLLALGGRQLARQGALLRRLRAGETLGAVTILVTDKTGTLTENRLRLAGITGDRREVLATALACQPPQPARREPMEAQLAEAAAADGITRDGDEVAVFPFDPARKLVSRASQGGDGIILAVSGAPEPVLDRCHLDPATRAGISASLARPTGQGMRVIAFARRRLDQVPADRDAAEVGLDYVGLAAFTDPLRDGVPAAVAALTRAGVATIVVTGDHPATADSVAIQAGLPASQVLPGGDADAMPDAELEPRLRHGAVIARATPAAMRRPPRPPGTGFLDRSVLAAIAVTAITLTLAVLPGYLLLAHNGASTGQARAAAVLAWLAADALIAWTLRTQPGLPWQANPAFPAWALAALATGTLLTLTPASQLIGLQALPPRWLPAVAGLVLIATTAAWAAARMPLLARRL